MTTISFIGDPHLGSFSRHGGLKVNGINTRGQLTLTCLRSALYVAHGAGAALAIILGDLFDSMRPEPQLLAEVRALYREMNKAGLEIWMLKGNHDSASDTPGDTALYAVIERGAKAIDVPTKLVHKNQTICMVPFRSGPITEWLPDTLRELAPLEGTILCLHAGIKDGETAPWLLSAPDAIERGVLSALMDQHEISMCFAGNWHDHRIWEEWDVHQVGALCPTGFANLGTDLYGKVAIWTREAGQADRVRYEQVPGPRFLKLGREAHPKDLPDTGNIYFVEWHVAPERYELAKTELEALVTDKRIFAGSVLPDGEGVQEGLTEAAFAARLAVGLDEAIGAYVGALKLPSHLRRESVEARVRSLLGGTS